MVLLVYDQPRSQGLFVVEETKEAGRKERPWERGWCITGVYYIYGVSTNNGNRGSDVPGYPAVEVEIQRFGVDASKNRILKASFKR